MFYKVLRFVLQIIFGILFRPKILGKENVPMTGGMIMAANHLSNWDPPMVGTYMPRPVAYMAKEELFHNPLLGWLIRSLGAFPVDRDGTDIQAVKTAMKAIREGDNLLIFPEGTTIRNGVGTHDGLPAHAHSGIAVIGVRAGATLVPVFADGKKRLFHKTRIIFGKPYVPQITGRRGTSEEMQKIADDILREAYALGGQSVGGGEA